MIKMKMENERVEHFPEQQLGEEWIRAITEGALERLEQFCHPQIMSRLLLPAGLVTLHNAADLVAEYQAWFGDCTDFKVEASRVGRVGERLGIFYRFLLQDHGEWYRIEQQLYCILKDGHVAQLHLLCSGFQLAGTSEQAAPVEAPEAQEQDPIRNGLLEFYGEGSAAGSTCALLTPMIKSKLGELQSGQVLEVRVDDPTAKSDVEAWSRLSGNTLLKVIDTEGPELRFFVKKK
jgi:tRNA 2-thiouridine synthesizing protein A